VNPNPSAIPVAGVLFVSCADVIITQATTSQLQATGVTTTPMKVDPLSLPPPYNPATAIFGYQNGMPVTNEAALALLNIQPTAMPTSMMKVVVQQNQNQAN